MTDDADALRRFYSSPLGRYAADALRARLRRFWPDLRGRTLLGLGYCAPFLDPFCDEAERVLALVSPHREILHWPPEGPNRVAVAGGGELPLPDLSVERLLMVHAIERSGHLRATMREAWRVLADGGRLLAVVPNRRGVWAWTERTPFGHGQPYSAGQLRRLIEEFLFTPEGTGHALYLPPLAHPAALRAAGLAERAGRRLLPAFSGVVMVEASKTVHALTGMMPAAAPGRRYVASGRESAPGLRRAKGARASLRRAARPAP